MKMMDHFHSGRKAAALLVTLFGLGAGVITPFVAAPVKDETKLEAVAEEEVAMADKGKMDETAEVPATAPVEEEPENEMDPGIPENAEIAHIHNMTEEIIQEPSCTTEGLRLYRCPGCDYSFTETLAYTGHTPGDWTRVSDTQVVLTCTRCGETLGSEYAPVQDTEDDEDEHVHNWKTSVEKEATCTSTGIMKHFCSCGRSYNTDIPMLPHNYTKTIVVDPTCSKEGKIINECEACGFQLETAVLNKLPHTLGAEEVTKEATCTDDGEKKQVCEVCQEEVVTVIPATGHDLGEYMVTVEANCESDGEETAECNTCHEKVTRTIPAIGHNFIFDSKVDATCNTDGSEKYVCDKCGKEKVIAVSATGHTPGEWDTDVEATCTSDGSRHKLCTVCGSELETEVIPAKGHAYGEEQVDVDATCLKDGSKHKTCEACGDTVTEAIPATGHTEGDWVILKDATDLETGLKQKTCTVCGEKLKEEIIPKLPHTHEYTEESEKVDPDCEAAGSRKLTCRCGDSITETIKALGHSWKQTDHADASCLLGGYTVSTCERCGKESRVELDPLGHSVTEWTVEKEATDLEEGLEVKTCERCGVVVDSRKIDKLDHIHSYDTETEKQDPTCVNDGFVVRQCRCGETEREDIPATGHTESEWKVTLEPTYTELGSREKRCTVCDTLLKTESIEVIPHEHAYDEVISEEAGCTTKGLKTLTCTVCGDTKTEEIPATGHSEEWVTTKQANCTEAGTKTLKCSVCGNVSDVETIPATGHSESDWIVDADATCVANGSQHKSCMTCGANIATETIPATGHSYGGFETTKEPTCEEAGEQVSTCANCGDTISVSIDPKGHSFGDWIVDEEPTEDAEGSRHKECEDCGKVITEDIDPLPRHDHDFQETGREESTCTSTGSITYTCSECGESYSETIPMKDHQPGNWETKKAATEEETGLRVKKCTVCGEEVESEIIERLPHLHDYAVERVEPTCTEDGYVQYTCSCGDSSRDVLKATGHSYGETETVNPTCEKDGYTARTCENCGDRQEEVIPKLGHNYVETKNVAPTCEKEGVIERTCQNCQDVQTETVSALAHDYVETKVMEPTCTEGGYIERTCRNCGKIITANSGAAKGHTTGEWEVTKEAALGVDGEKVQKCTECGETLQTETIPMIMTDGTDNVYFVDLGNGEKHMVLGHFDEDAEAQIYNLVNSHRSSIGVQEFARLADFDEMADTRAIESVYLSEHIRPNGAAIRYGENLFAGSGSYTGESVHEAWMNSSGHRANIEKVGTTNFGVSIFRYVIKTYESGKKVYGTTAIETFGKYPMAEYNDDSLWE